MKKALLQKTYTVDFLTKKTEKNEGELPQVYVENAHDAIIDKKAFDLVQIETERRKGIKHYSGISIFSGKVYCGECGAFFGRKVWHSNDKYKKIVYRCNRKYDGGEIATIGKNTIDETTAKSGKATKVCTTGIITEEEIKELFVKEYNKLDVSKAIKNAKKVMKNLTDTDSLDSKLKEENEKATSLVYQINELIDKNSRVAMDQDEFKKEKERLSDLYNLVKKILMSLQKK